MSGGELSSVTLQQYDVFCIEAADQCGQQENILHQVLLGEFIERLIQEDINLTGVALPATLLCPHTCLLSANCLVRHIADDRAQEVTRQISGQ